MIKQFFITAMLTLVGLTGQAQIKCHIKGKLVSDKVGDEVIICKIGTDLRVNDAPQLHHKAVNGYFECDIEADLPEMYEVFSYKQYVDGDWYRGLFLVENGTVNVEIYDDKEPKTVSTGDEGLLHQAMDSVIDTRFRSEIMSIKNELEEHREKYFKPDFLSYVDHERKLGHIHTGYSSKREDYTDEGWRLFLRQGSLSVLIAPFEVEYYEQHPMLWAYYDILEDIEMLKHAKIYQNFNSTPYENMVALYESKLCNMYKDHPVHKQIATALTALRLQPGKPYIDYSVRNVDGELVPISSLIKGKVVLIDLWASWCGSCRLHSMAMIPVYERYKDKGFTVIAIARENKREDMEKAAKKDGYPWTSLLELKDENHIWEKNGTGNGGGGMFLIDRDGTILSTSTETEELEPLIKKALNIE